MRAARAELLRAASGAVLVEFLGGKRNERV